VQGRASQKFEAGCSIAAFDGLQLLEGEEVEKGDFELNVCCDGPIKRLLQRCRPTNLLNLGEQTTLASKSSVSPVPTPQRSLTTGEDDLRREYLDDRSPHRARHRNQVGGQGEGRSAVMDAVDVLNQLDIVFKRMLELGLVRGAESVDPVCHITCASRSATHHIAPRPGSRIQLTGCSP